MKEKEEECRIKNSDHDIQELWEKVQQLQDGQMLYTTFGPNGRYAIVKDGNIYEFRGNDCPMFTCKDKLQFYKEMPTVGHLTWFLEIDAPQIYARNEFDGNLRHMDNWRALVKSFKTVQKDKYKELKWLWV